MIVSGVFFSCFLCLFTGLSGAGEQRALDGNEEMLAIGSTIIEKMNEKDLSGKLKTDIWLYKETWSTEPAPEGRLNLKKAGTFLGTVEKGSRVKIVGFKRLVGDYRPSRDLIVKDRKVDFLCLKVLSGKEAGVTGWFRKGTENLVKFSVSE